MSTEKQWQDAKVLYPTGTEAHAKVKAKFPFGVFLELEKAPEVTAFLDIASYNPEDESSPASLPDIDSLVVGIVSSHVERDKQIRIRVGPELHHIIDQQTSDPA